MSSDALSDVTEVKSCDVIGAEATPSTQSVGVKRAERPITATSLSGRVTQRPRSQACARQEAEDLFFFFFCETETHTLTALRVTCTGVKTPTV